jgi:hypothetical protein
MSGRRTCRLHAFRKGKKQEQSHALSKFRDGTFRLRDGRSSIEAKEEKDG